MVLCQVQNIRIIGWLKTSYQINRGYVFGACMSFRCAFSVDTKMPLPYTFFLRIESFYQWAKEEGFTPS